MIDPATIPAELRESAQWVVWKFSERGGKTTKIPYTPDLGREAKSNDPQTWRSFEDCLAALEGGGWEGVGYVISSDDPYVGVDLDDCIVDGVVDQRAQDITSACNTWAEISPSGTGVKLIGRGKKPAGFSNGDNIECYDRARFWTVTGNSFGELLPIREVQLAGVLPAKVAVVHPVGDSPVPAGERHNTYLKLAGVMRRAGAETPAILAALREENALRSPDHEDADLVHIAESVARYDPKAKDPPAELSDMTWEDHAAFFGGIEWVWQDWMARGFVTMLVGPPEIGKSSLALHLAGCVVDGRRLPDLSEIELRGKVCWVDTEAGQVLNYARAREWGVDLSKVVTPTLNKTTEDISLGTPDGWASFDKCARRDDVALVVVDSLGGAVLRENAEEMKEFIQKLCALARDTHKPIILIHHKRKLQEWEAGQEFELDQIRGSSAIVQFVRTIWAVETPDNTSPEMRRLRVVKNNIGLKPEPLGFEITGEGLSFSEAPSAPEDESKLQAAEELIRTILKDKKQEAASVFSQRAKDADIAARTLRRAKKHLGLGKAFVDGRWMWTPPPGGWGGQKGLNLGE